MSAFEDVHKPLPTTSSPLPSNPFLTSSPIRTNPTNEGDDQARFEGLISPPLFPSPPRTAMPAVDLRSASFDALHTTSSSSSKPSVPLLTELQTAQTTLIASLCHQLQESTMSHYHNTVQSLTEMYEDRLLHQQQHYTSIITSLTQQIQSLTQQSTQQQSVQEQLQQQLDTRTLKMSTFLHEKHVNMYSKPFFSLQRIFTTWKQDYKRNKRCRKVEQFIIRIDRKVCLQKYFQQLQSFVEENRQEKYLTEMKFKYETLSNEMVEEYESEVSRLRAECTEAYHGIDLEKEKQQQVAEDMRTLFLQHMTTINMQAMTLFHPGSNVGVAPPVQQSTGEGSPTILRSSSGSLSPMPRSTSPMSLMTMKEEIGGGGSSASVPSTPYMNQSQDLSFQQSVGGGYPQHRAFVSPAVTKTQELLHETPVSSNNGSKGHYDKLQDMYKTSISSSNKFVNTSSNVAAHNRPSYAGSTRTAVGAPAATANTNKRVPGSASQPPGSAARTYGNTPGSARAPGKWN